MHRALDGQINFVQDFYRADDETASLYSKTYPLTPEEAASDLSILNGYNETEDRAPTRCHSNNGVAVGKDGKYYYLAIVEEDLGPR
ncbi:hypothetical protein CDES_01880 [Corynebacterium deserti GIMN1.010]|uniref:Uncharacterized protein n=1 Tax=Corynebacterium deserti GIMN1.010 TaxID=931089 RepID=A0A0M4CMY7_9CORY|nr:hypothetical protein [Corynebacterium deserti]ALC04842.1 hypothetical protein CDES_01880 [Corynebacterium deserti GIMN1.010]